MAHSTLHAAYQLIIRITLAAGVTTLLPAVLVPRFTCTSKDAAAARPREKREASRSVPYILQYLFIRYQVLVGRMV